MTSKEAKSILNAYRNRNYNSTFRDEVELANAIDIVLPKYVELEKRYTPMKVIKTPQERLLELGFITTDETNYSITYLFNGLEIIIFKKEKTYQTYVHGDNYKPINLKLAEVLVDYLKELENE